MMRRFVSLMVLALLLLPGVAQAQQKTLELWTFIDPAGDAPRSKALAEIIRTFEAQNPGVKVKPTVFAWNQIGLQFLKAAQAGRTPDVTMLNSGRMQRHVAAGMLRPLDDYLDKTGQRADYILLPNALAGGKTYGVPYEVRALGFLYRSDLLEKAGLPVPGSLADLTAAAKRMQEITGSNFIGVGIGFDPTADSAEKFYVPAVAALGGKILKDDGSADFVSPQAIKVMNYVHDLVHKDKVMPLDVGLTGPDQVRTLVESGRVGFYFQGSHWLLTLRGKLPQGAKLDFMPVPQFAGGGWQPVFVEGWNLGIPVAAKEPDLAWKLMALWTSPEIQVMQSKTAGYLPMRKSAAAMVDPNSPDTAHVKPLLEVISSNAMKFRWPINTDALQEALGNAIVSVIADKQTPEQALREAEKSYDSMRE
jgi:ABC-type glycerol-3-phosphate transport system substrate-binding protein